MSDKMDKSVKQIILYDKNYFYFRLEYNHGVLKGLDIEGFRLK